MKNVDTSKRTDVKLEIINMIIDKMNEDNLLPWQSGRLSNVDNLLPVNYVTRNKYRGINLLILLIFGSGTREYLTYNQAKYLNSAVKKGEHGLPILYYQLWNYTKHCASSKDVDEKNDLIRPFIKRYTVFSYAQTENLKTKYDIKTRIISADEKVTNAESMINKFLLSTNTNLTHEVGIGYYRLSSQTVNVAPRDTYESDDAYYSTLFHEMIHSTGLMLHRDMSSAFKNETYSAEEVVAAIGSMMLCNIFGYSSKKTNENNATYVVGWSKALRENPDWLISGANKAQKAVDYILEKACYQLDNSSVSSSTSSDDASSKIA